MIVNRRHAVSLSQRPALIQDRADCVETISGEAFPAVMHDGIEVIRDLEWVNISVAVLVEVMFFTCKEYVAWLLQ